MSDHRIVRRVVTLAVAVLALSQAPRAWAQCNAFTSFYQPTTCWSSGSSWGCCDNTPTQYLVGQAGDVVLSNTNVTLQPITSSVGMVYGHAQALYDNRGGSFTESFWDGVSPPTSEQTGEPHECSIPASPYCLARLNPGSLSNYTENAVPGTLISGMANPYCSVPSELYHFSSFLNTPTQDCYQNCNDWECAQDDNYGDCLSWYCNSYDPPTCTTETITGG